MAFQFALRKKGHAIHGDIDRILGQMERSLRAKNYNTYVLLNEQFHNLFYDASENEWLKKISQTLTKHKKMLSAMSLFSRDRFSHSIKEPKAIVDAFKKGEERCLAKAVNCHLTMFRRNIVESLSVELRE